MVETIKTTMELSSVHRGRLTMYAARLAHGPERWPIYVPSRRLQALSRTAYRHHARTPYVFPAIDAGARTSRGGWSVRGSVQSGSRGRSTPLVKGWVDVRPGRRGPEEDFMRKYNGGMLPSKGCAGHIANLAMILDRQSQSNPREADPWTSVSHCASVRARGEVDPSEHART